VNVTLSHAAGGTPSLRLLSKEEVLEKLSWRHPRLEFSGTPLREVIAVINQYNRTKLVLADAELETLAISGALRADRIDALAAMLESDLHLRLQRRGAEIVISKPAP
jgi:transmembrane sensor